MTTLERRAIPRYLLDRRLVTAREVVDGGLRIVDASRSHTVSLVRVADRGGFAVKQHRPEDPETANRIRRESQVYRFAGTRDSLREAMPAFHGDGESSELVVLELLDPAETLLPHNYRLGGLAPEVAASLGAAIAGWHRDTRGSDLDGLPGHLPWVFTLFEPGPAQFAWQDPNMGAALATLPDAPGLMTLLKRAAERWQRDCLMHGDLRSDNCLVIDGGPEVKVIDWELADHGDPAWDVGGILQEYLAQEALRGGALALPTPEGVLAATPFGDASPRSIAAALWRGYVPAAQLPDAEAARELIERSITFAGARMVQSTLEYASRDGPQSPVIAPLFRMSASLMGDGQPFVDELLSTGSQ